MSSFPEELKYTKSHEWVRAEDNGLLTIGITDHAQDLLGDMVFVELPDVGSHFDAEEEFAVVESVKAASDVYCPLAGEVVEVNSELEDAPELINKNAYHDGWLVRIKPDNADDIDNLLDASDYADVVAEDEH